MMGYSTTSNTVYPTIIQAIRRKKRSEDSTIRLTPSSSSSANGLYKADCTTAPTPHSHSEMKPRNCVIDETNPFTSDP